jgi:hypothetical protein
MAQFWLMEVIVEDISLGQIWFASLISFVDLVKWIAGHDTMLLSWGVIVQGGKYTFNLLLRL